MPENFPARFGEPAGESLDSRVQRYSVSALAAGVSLLALAQPADAEVIVTRARLPVIDLSEVVLDLDKDGTADFRFQLNLYAEFGAVMGYVAQQPLNGGAVVGAQGRNFGYASALVRGAKIGPSAHFSSANSLMVERSFGTHAGRPSYSRHVYGKWGGNPANRFLGVKFFIHGAAHYGWIRLTLDSAEWPMSATITGYAYESVANRPIFAGLPPNAAVEAQSKRVNRAASPASLGMLALGAEALPRWRRDQALPF